MHGIGLQSKPVRFWPASHCRAALDKGHEPEIGHDGHQALPMPTGRPVCGWSMKARAAPYASAAVQTSHMPRDWRLLTASTASFARSTSSSLQGHQMLNDMAVDSKARNSQQPLSSKVFMQSLSTTPIQRTAEPLLMPPVLTLPTTAIPSFCKVV